MLIKNNEEKKGKSIYQDLNFTDNKNDINEKKQEKIIKVETNENYKNIKNIILKKASIKKERDDKNNKFHSKTIIEPNASCYINKNI